MKNTILKYPYSKQVFPKDRTINFSHWYTPQLEKLHTDMVSWCCLDFTTHSFVPCAQQSLHSPIVLMTRPTKYISLGHLIPPHARWNPERKPEQHPELPVGKMRLTTLGEFSHIRKAEPGRVKTKAGSSESKLHLFSSITQLCRHYY